MNTPRTEAAKWDNWNMDGSAIEDSYVDAEFARTLESELEASRRECAQLSSVVDKCVDALDRVKRAAEEESVTMAKSKSPAPLVYGTLVAIQSISEEALKAATAELA